MTLSADDIDAIGRRVVELLGDRAGMRWGDVKDVAEALGVQERWVYEHARRLGGVKLGPAKGAPWRFDMKRVHQVVASGVLEGHAERGVNGSGRSSPDPASRSADSRLPATPAGPRLPARPGLKRPPRPGFDDVAKPLAILDLSGKFTTLNPAFSRLVGYSEEQFSRASWPSPHDRPTFAERSASLRAVAAGEVEEIAFAGTYLHGQGLVVEVRGTLALVRDAKGNPEHLLLSAQTGR